MVAANSARFETGGGVTGSLGALSCALARHGAEVTLFAPQHGARETVGCRLPRGQAVSQPSRAALAPGVVSQRLECGYRAVTGYGVPEAADDLVHALHRLWRAHRPDVVHAHCWASGLAAVRAAAGLGIPVVLTLPAAAPRRSPAASAQAAETGASRRAPADGELLSLVDGVVAGCAADAFELLRLGADRARLHVVPAGVDLREFAPDGPVDVRIARWRVVAPLGATASGELADVLAALVALPEVELVVSPSGSEDDRPGEHVQSRLEAVATALGVADRAAWRELSGSNAALLRSADVVVSVPSAAPVGTGVLEAMACGVPVVASAIGPHVDAFVHGVSGLFVAERDGKRLAAALRALLADQTLRDSIGAAALARVRRRHGWDRIALRTLGVYASVLSGRSTRRRQRSLEEVDR